MTARHSVTLSRGRYRVLSSGGGDSEEQCASKQLEGWTSDVQATAMPGTQAWKYKKTETASAVH